jgi:hypothetical protein
MSPTTQRITIRRYSSQTVVSCPDTSKRGVWVMGFVMSIIAWYTTLVPTQGREPP